jgi:hypothetical protein
MLKDILKKMQTFHFEASLISLTSFMKNQLALTILTKNCGDTLLANLQALQGIS